MILDSRRNKANPHEPHLRQFSCRMQILTQCIIRI